MLKRVFESFLYTFHSKSKICEISEKLYHVALYKTNDTQQMDFDLDIHQYEVPDLERIFKLDSNKRYTPSEIQNRVAQFQEILLKTGHVSKHFKRDLLIFLQQAESILIEHKSIKPKSHTSLPQNNQSSSDIPSTTQFPVVEPPSRPSRIDEMVERKPHHFTYAHPSEFVPGTLNPLETRTIKKCITIDTRFRTNPYSTKSSDFIVSLPNRITKAISLECISFEMAPKSIPNISASLQNNFFYVSVDTSTQTHTHIFTVPDGYYTVEQLRKTLDTALQLAVSPFNKLSLQYNSNNNNQKLCLQFRSSSTSTQSIQKISLDFRRNDSGTVDNQIDYFARLGRILGFTKRLYNIDLQTTQWPLHAETVPNSFLDLTYFYLVVDDFQNRAAHNFEPAFSKMTIPTSTIARLGLLPSSDAQTRIEPLSIISTPRKYFGPVDIHRMQIRLLDVYGKTLAMDGADYSFTLIANLIYDV